MSFDILEKELKTLPEKYQQEIIQSTLEQIELMKYKVHFFDKEYKIAVFEKKISLTDKINSFLKENPNSFEEFKPNLEANAKRVGEFLKNDEW